MSTSEPSDTAAAATPDPERARALVFPLYGARVLRTGESFTAHAQAMAAIVAAVRPDPDLLAAAILFGAHDVLRDADDWIRTHFGPAVAQLVADLRQLMLLSESVRKRMREAAPEGAAVAHEEAQDEALRRMLLAMVNDLRVVLLRLASRLQTLRFLAASRSDDAAAYARETTALYAPLANRLGIWQVKWELEDLSLRLLEPETYKRIAGLLEQKRTQREQHVERAIETLRGLLQAAGIVAEISGRPKHIASIAQKMRAKELAFEQVYDVRALRVIVERLEQCYEVLALVNQQWKPIDSEFDDYIARPKPNGYQSLHTVIRAEDKRPVEIQIRTRRMHESAELGVAAHWRYKEGGKGDSADTDRVAWLRRLLDWRQDVDPTRTPGQQDRIYVMTPQGRVVELPAGATAIDFAYHIHTELGHRCRGARVDGALVSLNTRLRTGQSVEVISARTGGPSRDWLNPELGFLASARSRAKVRQWFNAIEIEQSISHGREVVDRELQRLGRTAVKLEELARRMGFGSVEQLCLAAGKDEIGPRALELALAGEPAAAEATPASAARVRPAAAGQGQVLVVGVDALMTSLARCCRPIPPDEIIGFVTRGRGVSVHRAHCVNAGALSARHPERVIEVGWGNNEVNYPVDVFVLAQDRQGLLRDISEVFAREKLNVIGVNTVSQRDQAHMQFTVEVPNAAALRRSLAQVTEIKGVIAARRR